MVRNPKHIYKFTILLDKNYIAVSLEMEMSIQNKK